MGATKLEDSAPIDSTVSSIGPIKATILNWYLFVSRVTPKKDGEPAQSVFLMAFWIGMAWYPFALVGMDLLERIGLDQDITRSGFVGTGIAAFVVGIVVASIGRRIAMRLNLERFPRISFGGFASFMLLVFWSPMVLMASLTLDLPALGVAAHVLTLAYFWATRKRPFASAPRAM